MKKYALDTNALISMCKSDEMTEKLLSALTDRKIKTVVNKRTLEEFLKGPDSSQLVNYSKLSSCLVNDDQQFFTLDESSLDGGDPLPSHTYESMVKDYSEEAYETYKERTTKNLLSRQEWVRRLQGDPTIYAWAELTGCNYFVTDDKALRKKAPKIGLKIIPVATFMKHIAKLK